MGEHIEIEIIECKNPSLFLARASCAEELKVFLAAEKAWNADLERKEDMAVVNYQPQLHEVCAVKSEKEGWQRVKVEQLFHSTRGELASCFFMDTGKKLNIPLFRLRQLPEQYLSVPYQVRTLKLWGLRPLTLQFELSDTGFEVPQRPGKKWDTSAVMYFQELVDKSFSAQAEVMHQDVEGTMYVHLHLLQPEGWLCVNDRLIEEGYAVQKTLPATGMDSDSSCGSELPVNSAGDAQPPVIKPLSPNGVTSLHPDPSRSSINPLIPILPSTQLSGGRCEAEGVTASLRQLSPAGDAELLKNLPLSVRSMMTKFSHFGIGSDTLKEIAAITSDDMSAANDDALPEEKLNHLLAKIDKIHSLPSRGYQSDTEGRVQRSSRSRSQLLGQRPGSARESGAYSGDERKTLILHEEFRKYKAGQSAVGAGGQIDPLGSRPPSTHLIGGRYGTQRVDVKTATEQSQDLDSMLKMKTPPQNGTRISSRGGSIQQVSKNETDSLLTMEVSIPALEPLPREEEDLLPMTTSASGKNTVLTPGARTVVAPKTVTSLSAHVSSSEDSTVTVSSVLTPPSSAEASASNASVFVTSLLHSSPMKASVVSTNASSASEVKTCSPLLTFESLSLSPAGVLQHSQAPPQGGRGRALRKLLSSDILKEKRHLQSETTSSVVSVSPRVGASATADSAAPVKFCGSAAASSTETTSSVMSTTQRPGTSIAADGASSDRLCTSAAAFSSSACAAPASTCTQNTSRDTHQQITELQTNRVGGAVTDITPVSMHKQSADREASTSLPSSSETHADLHRVLLKLNSQANTVLDQGEDTKSVVSQSIEKNNVAQPFSRGSPVKYAAQSVCEAGIGDSPWTRQLSNTNGAEDNEQTFSDDGSDSLLISKTKLVGRCMGRELLDLLGAGDSGTNGTPQLPQVWRSDRLMPTPLLGTTVCGTLLPDPVYDISDIAFTDFVKETLKKGIKGPNALQAYTWPAILRGRHVIGIAPAEHGKTLAYVPALLTQLAETDYLSLPKGSGPKALVLVPSWRKAHKVGEYVFGLLDRRHTIRSIVIYAGGREEDQVLPVLEGCDLLIATPHCLLRMIDSGYTNLRRLCHLVLDDAEVLVEQFTPQIQQIMTIYASCLENSRKLVVPRRILVFATAWTPGIASFQSEYQQDPVLVFASRLEASVYGKVQQVVHLCLTDAKQRLVGLLNELTTGPDHRRIIVAAESDEQVHEVAELLKSQSIYAQIVDSTLGPSAEDVEERVNHWRSQAGSSAVLVVTDSMVIELRVMCAHVVINYGLPKSKTTFGNRLITMHSYYRDEVGGTTDKSAPCPVSHIIISAAGLDRKRLEHIRSLRDFLARSGAVIPEGLKALLRGMYEGLNEDQTKKWCGYLKAFGECVNESRCENRHLVLPVDFGKNPEKQSWPPAAGEVKILVTNVISANHFYVRILEHRESGQPPCDNRGVFTKLMMQMTQFLQKPENQSPYALEQGTRYLAAVRDEDGVFHRAHVLTTLAEKLRTKSTKVKVRYVDEGSTGHVNMEQLLKLPPHLQEVPPQGTEVYVCRIKPVDGDTDWTQRSTDFVKEQISNKELVGTVVLRMKNTLWLDPLSHQTRLSSLKTQVVTMILRNELLKRGMANDNPDHIKNLYKLCEGKISIPKALIQKYVAMPVTQRIETETLDEEEEYHEVYISHISSPHLFFIQKKATETELEAVVDDLNRYMEKIVKTKSESLANSPLKSGTATPAQQQAKGADASPEPGTATPPQQSQSANSGLQAMDKIVQDILDAPVNTQNCHARSQPSREVSEKSGGAIPKQPQKNGLSPLKNAVACSGHNASPSSASRRMALLYGEAEFIPEAGSLCAAKFGEDNRWYRGRLIEAVEGGWRVFFLDYGENEVVSEDSIYRLADRFCILPAQAIECSLASVVPAGEDWSEECVDALFDMSRYITEEKKVMVVRVQDREEAKFTGSARCVVDLFDTTLPHRDLHVNQELVWLGLASREDDDHLTDLYPETTYSARKLYPSLGEKIYAICAALFWTDNEDRAKTLAKLASDSLLAELTLGKSALFESEALQAVVNLIGYVKSCDAQATILSALVKCVETKPSVCMAAAGETLTMRLVFCMEQARNPQAQLQAASTAAQLARVEGFRAVLDREEIVSMFCYILEAGPLSELLHPTCSFLTVMLHHGQECPNVCEKMKMCGTVLKLLSETSRAESQEVILGLLSAASTHEGLHASLLREPSIAQIVAVLKNAPSQQCVFHSAYICLRLCQASRRNKRQFLEAGLVIVLRDLLDEGLQSPAKEVCQELNCALAVSLPQQEVLAGVQVTRQQSSARSNKMIFPRTKWSQNTFRVLLTVMMCGAKETDFIFTQNEVHCRCEAEGHMYGFDLKLFGNLETERCRVKVGASEVILSLRKQEKGMWSRLTKDKVKNPHLTTDYDHLVDSGSESEVEEDENLTVLAKKRVIRLPKYEPGPEPVHRFSFSEDSEDSQDAVASYSEDERFDHGADGIDYGAFMDAVIERTAGQNSS